LSDLAGLVRHGEKHQLLKQHFMEQFMLIFHGASNPNDYNYYGGPDAMQAQMEKWFAWIEKLRKSGQYVSGEALSPEGKVVSARAVTDGPYTESKEIVGGYFVIKAKDYQEAVDISKNGFPDFEFGGKVEVRQVMKSN
jgi:hypothetical protein